MAEAVPAKYLAGSMVETKIGGYRGMVVSVGCTSRTCYYDIRVDAPQTRTNTRLFGADGPLTSTPLALLTNIREFELK
jgi:hypothetical protein